MKDRAKTKAQLIAELTQLRQRVDDLETAMADHERRAQQQRDQIRALGMRLADVEEAERRRLARELHDQVGQRLTAIGINLDIIRAVLPEALSGEISARLEEARTLVTETTRQVRQVMVDLRPEMLDDYGLLAALRWAAEQFARRLGLKIVVEGEEFENRLPRQLENVLYRVVQEALTNVAKHAQASQVTLRLSADNDMVKLVVVDNGVGFRPGRQVAPAQGSRWGLVMMAERVEGLNGRFRVESGPGQGTRIIVEVPR